MRPTNSYRLSFSFSNHFETRPQASTQNNVKTSVNTAETSSLAANYKTLIAVLIQVACSLILEKILSQRLLMNGFRLFTNLVNFDFLNIISGSAQCSAPNAFKKL